MAEIFKYTRKPCEVGDAVEDVDTPALLVCLDSFDQNLSRLPEMMKSFPGLDFRPHIKTHKCPDIAMMQIKSGAVGVCCQTVTEAEAMSERGVPDVFISNQVVEKKKLLRLSDIARRSRLSVCVDNSENIDVINNIAKQSDVTLDLVIEVNCGGNRCGVGTVEEVVQLAKQIQSLSNVIFKGLHCYNGPNQHISDFCKRSAGVDYVVRVVKDTLEALKTHDIDCKYVTGGGSGTFQLEAASGVFTEIQAGSYVMMDVDYLKNKDVNKDLVPDFKAALYVLSTVISVQKHQAVVNAGMKALSPDSGPPLVMGRENLKIDNGADEHCIISPRDGLKLGERVWLIPGHCDPTVNLHNWIVGVRGGKVEAMWPVTGRGPGL